MKKLRTIFVFALPVLLLASCQSFSLDKDRAAERRKQELCGEIDTRDLPHCSGYGTGFEAVPQDMINTLEKAGISPEIVKDQAETEVKYHNRLSNATGSESD